VRLTLIYFVQVHQTSAATVVLSALATILALAILLL
jgi:hypothetical protein